MQRFFVDHSIRLIYKHSCQRAYFSTLSTFMGHDIEHHAVGFIHTITSYRR